MASVAMWVREITATKARRRGLWQGIYVDAVPLILLPNLKRNIILITNYATFAENIKKL